MKQLIKRALTFSSALALSLSSLAILPISRVYADDAVAEICIWTGADSGTDTNISNPANWDSNGCDGPDLDETTGAQMDTLVFPATPTFKTATVNVAGQVAAIQFTGTYGTGVSGYTINGSNILTVTSVQNNGTGTNADQVISAPVTFTGTSQISNTDVDASLTFSGAVLNGVGGETLTITGGAVSDNNVVVFSSTLGGSADMVLAEGVTTFGAPLTGMDGNINVQSGAVLNAVTTTSPFGVTTATSTTVESGGAIYLPSGLTSTDETLILSGSGNTAVANRYGAVIANGNTNLTDVTLAANTVVCNLANSTALNMLNGGGAVDTSSFTLRKAGATSGSLCVGLAQNNGNGLQEDTGTPSEPVDPEACSELTGTVTIADGSCGKVTSPITGDITVTGTLFGTSTITGNVTTTDTGTIAPGLSPGCLMVT